MIVNAIVLKLLFFLCSLNLIGVKSYPIVTSERLELTRQYCRLHYGMDSYTLKNPKIIVIHYTAIDNVKDSLNYFIPAVIWPDRSYIKRFGRLNVGVHFLVDKNGDIYSLLPTDIIGRHVIGFNHVSIGIENVARNDEKLTLAQLKSNARLIKAILMKFPSIEYLIGHLEYTDSNLPHYRLFLERVKGYKPTVKSDPGKRFMRDLRKLLKEEYRIVLEK
jgi:N-acetylmuramoyl-L-alanine amidase